MEGRRGGYGPWARVGGLPPGIFDPPDHENAFHFALLIVEVKTSFRFPGGQVRQFGRVWTVTLYRPSQLSQIPAVLVIPAREHLEIRQIGAICKPKLIIRRVMRLLFKYRLIFIFSKFYNMAHMTAKIALITQDPYTLVPAVDVF